MALTAKFVSDFSRFFADVQKATGMLGTMQTEADKVGDALDWKGALAATAGAVGVAFSVNAVKNFAVDVINAGAKIGDLSEKLGISAEAVQRFSYAADQSGASIDTVDRAIKAMNVNLAQGSDSTVAALAAAGLKFEDIRRMAPEDAFVAIGDAVAGIEDPMLRAQVATELFGKAGQELLPTFLAGIKEVGEETEVMSDKTVARLKAAQDMWARLGNTVVVTGGEMIGRIIEIGSSWKEMAKNLVLPPGLQGALGMGRQALNFFRTDVTQTASDVGAMVARLNTVPPSLVPVALSLEEATDVIAEMDQTIMGTPINLAAMEAAQDRAKASREMLTAITKLASASEFEWQNQLALTKFKADQLTISETQLTEATGTLAEFTAAHAGEMYPEPPEGNLQSWMATERAIRKVTDASEEMGKTQAALNARMSDVTGILSGIDAKWAQTATVAARAIQGITNDLISGNWVGAIMKASAALVGFIGHLFGASEESKKVSPMRDEFFKLQGGLETLNPKVQALEGNLESVQAVFDAKTVQQYDAAVKNLNRILDQNTSSFDEATDSAEDYARVLKSLPKNPGTFAGGGGGGSSTQMVPGFAGGSGGFVDFGAGTLAMLHGKEAVVPASGAGSLGGNVVIQINAQGAFFDTPGDLQRLAEKVNTALTAKYGLTNRARAA